LNHPPGKGGWFSHDRQLKEIRNGRKTQDRPLGGADRDRPEFTAACHIEQGASEVWPAGAQKS
jgi:hypothetical protein